MNKLLSLFLTTVVFGSCEDINPNFDPSYFPLQVGNYWEYHPSVQQDHLVSIIREIPSKTTIEGREYYLMVSRFVYSQAAPGIDSTYYRIDDKGKQLVHALKAFT